MWVRGVGNVKEYVALIVSIVSISLDINLHLKPEFNLNSTYLKIQL
jgi:hypothetical protein